MSEFHDPHAPPKGPVTPVFRAEAVHMPFLSKQEGRPIYEQREFVTILIPGDRHSQASEPVNDEHKTRWANEYAAFKAGLELPLEGTPLQNWPNSALNRARVEELAYFHIRTVEHLAAVNDNQLQNLGMGARELRQAARTFLEVSRTGTGPLERLLADNQRLTDENERLKREVVELAALASASRPKPRGANHASA